MRILVTGGTGVLGRATVPRLRRLGHAVDAPPRRELDLFDPGAVARAVAGTDAVLHLATRIPPRERMGDPRAWADNDRLRADASRILVDVALAGGPTHLVVPTVALVYPPGPADETTPVGDVPAHLRSALVAEAQVLRFAAAGRTGVVLRLGLLYGPSTSSRRNPDAGATLHVEDAGRALVAALTVPSGIYNVVEDDGRVSGARFRSVTGWTPRRGAGPRPAGAGQRLTRRRVAPRRRGRRAPGGRGDPRRG